MSDGVLFVVCAQEITLIFTSAAGGGAAPAAPAEVPAWQAVHEPEPVPVPATPAAPVTLPPATPAADATPAQPDAAAGAPSRSQNPSVPQEKST